MNDKKVLAHLIRAGRDALNLENVLTQLGYKETPYFNLYGEIADAIYCILDEHTDSFEESVTYAVMNDPLTPDEVYAENLAKLLNTASDSGIEIPNVTKEIIIESAERRGISYSAMIRLVLNEWARQETYYNHIQI